MTKKIYNQPNVQVTNLMFSSLICVSVGGDSESGAGKVNPGVPTDEQW